MIASAAELRDTSAGDGGDVSSPRPCSDDSRPCGWCRRPIPANARRDAKFCGQRCRQAAHRFGRGMVRTVASIEPRRFAYADPPYPGKAWLYRDHPDFGGEVDHAALIRRLADEYDGWALSTSAAALPAVLALCPPGVHVAAWFRGERPTASYRPLNAWEPVVYAGERHDPSTVDARRVDALVHVARARTTDPQRVIGAKPAAFCWWLFQLLGIRPGDTLDDLYPGSGGIGRAWALYTSAESLVDTSDQDLDDTSSGSADDTSREYSDDTSGHAGANTSRTVASNVEHDTSPRAADDGIAS